MGEAVVLLAIFGLLWSVLHFGRGMLVYFDEGHMPPLSTSPSDIPYYAGAHGAANVDRLRVLLLFTLIVGYVAAKNRSTSPHRRRQWYSAARFEGKKRGTLTSQICRI